MKEQEHIYFTYKRIVTFAFTYLALTTAYTVWQVSGGWFSGLSPTLTLLLRLAACVVMYYAIDAGLAGQIRFVVRVLGDGDQRRAAGAFFIALSILVVAIRFPTTTAVTYLAAGPMASAIYKAPDNSDKLQSIEKAQAAKAGDVAALKREYDQLKRSERARIAESEKSGKSAINSAIASQGSRVEELYRSGNAWLMQDRKFKAYREGIRAAKIEAANLVQAEKDKTEQARRAYLAALSGKDVVAEAIATDIKAQTEQYSRTVSGMTTAIYIIDFIAAFVAFILSIAVVAYERKNKVAYASPFADLANRLKDRYTKDVLDNAEGAGLALWSFFVAMPLQKTVTALRWLSAVIWVKMVGSLERLLQIDLDGNGNIGNKSVKPPTQTTDAPEQKVGRNPIGFSVNKTDVKVGEKSAGNTDALHAKNTDVGVTPTSPTSAPTFTWENLQKVDKKSVENSPTSPPTRDEKSADFSGAKSPTSRQEKPKKIGTGRAAGDTDLDRMADAARSAWNRFVEDQTESKHELWRDWRARLLAAGFTIISSPDGRKQTIIKPKAAERKSKPKKRS